MKTKAAMRLRWTRDPFSSGWLLWFGELLVGKAEVADAFLVEHGAVEVSGYIGNSKVIPRVCVYEGKSCAAAKRAVRDHVLREMEREVARAKKARKQ